MCATDKSVCKTLRGTIRQLRALEIFPIFIAPIKTVTRVIRVLKLHGRACDAHASGGGIFAAAKNLGNKWRGNVPPSGSALNLTQCVVDARDSRRDSEFTRTPVINDLT